MILFGLPSRQLARTPPGRRGLATGALEAIMPTTSAYFGQAENLGETPSPGSSGSRVRDNRPSRASLFLVTSARPSARSTFSRNLLQTHNSRLFTRTAMASFALRRRERWRAHDSRIRRIAQGEIRRNLSGAEVKLAYAMQIIHDP